MVSGVAHACNIIDGYNGLLLGYTLLVLLIFSLVSFWLGDLLILSIQLIMAGAVMGLFIFNFPYGLIGPGRPGIKCFQTANVF